MGLFDFVKSAGTSLFKKDEVEPDPTEENRRRAAAIRQNVQRLGFDVGKMRVALEGDQAVLTGEVASQDHREKIVLIVGNTAGIAQVDDRLVTPDDQADSAADTQKVGTPRHHTVERGDTLSKIAKKYYGNAMKYPVIFEANRPMLSDPDKIYPGQVLRIPELDEAPN